MLKQTTLLSLLILGTLLPQQASAFITVVKEVGEQQYVFQADNVDAALVGQPGGFKVRVSTGDIDADPTFADSEPVTGLTDMLRLNLHHQDTGARQTTLFTEESPGLYVARFTPTAGGTYTYTVAALLEGFPLSISITCVGGESEEVFEGEETEAPTEPTPSTKPSEELLREGEITCPNAGGTALRFPPDTDLEYDEEISHGSAPTAELQGIINSLVFSRTILYVITGVNLILSAIFGIMLSRAVF
ncbi:MAG TPA: hypothetical protein VI913_03675 [Candidatus Peribacteraceae bacterium]|nr:hypothetical protein [Candidatus Peribacteraceae bacterium]